MHAPLVKYPFDDCSNLLGCCKGWSRGGIVCSLVQLYASRVVGLTMQENFRCSNDSVVLATIRRSCNKSRNKSSNVEHGAVNERTGTRCGFTFRARAFRAFLVFFTRWSFAHALVGCWLLDVRGVYNNSVRGQDSRAISRRPNRTTQKWPQIHSVKEQVPSARDQTLCQ